MMAAEHVSALYDEEIYERIKKRAKGRRTVAIGDHNPGFKRWFREYDSFRRFAKESRINSFDMVIDFSLTSKLMKDNIGELYSYISRILKFDGTLYTLVRSTDSEYCRMHCPIRKWTIKDRGFVRFYTKKDICGLLEKRFLISSYNKLKIGDDIFHEIISHQKLRKIAKWKNG